MKKIPSLFKRDYEGTRHVYNEVVPGTEWVLAGEGVATEKYDGTSCLIQNGRLYKRYDCKKGRTPPANFEPCQPEPDPKTGHWPGWVPVGDGPEDKWHREAFDDIGVWPGGYKDGTYELIGPKVQGNPYNLQRHILMSHGNVAMPVPRTFTGIYRYLEENAIEGIVWHHPDGRMAKIKAKDFGLPWPRTQHD